MRWYRSPKALAVARFAAVFVLLVVPWPGLGRVVVDGFAAVESLLFAVPAASAHGIALDMHPAPREETAREWDLIVQVNDANSRAPLRHAAVHLRRSGYLQLIFLLALTALSPGSDRRRLAIALGAGLALAAVLAALPIAMFLAKHQFIAIGEGLQSALAVTYRSLVTAPGMAFALPGFLWLLIVRPLDSSTFAFLRGAKPSTQARRD